MERDLVSSIIIAFFVSLISWIIINYLLFPRLRIDDSIQHGKKYKFVRMKNVHLFMNAYDVVCSVEYYRNKYDIQPYYTITHDSKPILRHHGPFVMYRLNQKKSTKECFKNNGRIKIIVSFQNCFGIKHNIQFEDIYIYGEEK